jgi:hypothetical protein
MNMSLRLLPGSRSLFQLVKKYFGKVLPSGALWQFMRFSFPS